MMHKCPATHCTALLPQQMLFCRSHWFMLSMSLREKLNGAYTRRRSNVRAYYNIRQECIEHVNALLAQRKPAEERAS